MKYYEYYQNGTNGLSGLSNDGNTCFLASATQILITIPSIKRLVLAQFFCFDMTKVDLKNFCIIFCDVWHMNHKGMNRCVLSKKFKNIFLGGIFWLIFLSLTWAPVHDVINRFAPSCALFWISFFFQKCIEYSVPQCLKAKFLSLRGIKIQYNSSII